MMSYLTEAEIEAILLEQFQALDCTHLPSIVTNPDGSYPERESYADTILSQRLRNASDRLLPKLMSGEIRVKEAEQMVDKIL